jgi:catechol 2,3-dioxygenase-like lactoylglutathione lyase family enzyme
MIKAKSIRHTGVPVSDVRKAKRFYGEILGFDEIERPKIKGVPGAWYEVDGTQVHIIGQRNAMADKDIPGIGTHIAVQVEDLEEAKRVLKKRRVKFQEFAPPPNLGLAPVVFIRDPDGNVVELRTEA